MTRAESTGLGEESAGPARRMRARGSEKIARGRLGEKARRLGEESTEARRREHGSMSSEQKARRLGGPEQNSEGERWSHV